MTTTQTPPGREIAADMAAVASLLEMADRLGVLHVIRRSGGFRTADLAREADIPEAGAAAYLEAMTNAALVIPDGDGFRAAADIAERIYESGYMSWTLNANRPFIENVKEFLRDPLTARQHIHRDGRQVAVSSEWMGSFAFYPIALDTIREAKPSRVVDLGAGTARLLIEILGDFPEATAVALDLDGPACAEARRAADKAGVGSRLTVYERSIQSVATDPTPVEGADVVHAGFVFHDMMPEEEHIAEAVLRNCHNALKPGGMMAITDAVPYVQNERERRFSTMVTYYHLQFMGRKLLTEEEWLAKLSEAGFRDVKCTPHRFPTGRLFVATK
jgi:SAM-dependent methyltransferase